MIIIDSNDYVLLSNFQEFRVTCEHILSGDQIVKDVRVNGERIVNVMFTDLMENSEYFVYVLTTNSSVQPSSLQFSTHGKNQQFYRLSFTFGVRYERKTYRFNCIISVCSETSPVVRRLEHCIVDGSRPSRAKCR